MIGPARAIGCVVYPACEVSAPGVIDHIEGNLLHLLGIDVVDGTPVLDIKPYLPEYDAFPGATTPS